MLRALDSAPYYTNSRTPAMSLSYIPVLSAHQYPKEMTMDLGTRCNREGRGHESKWKVGASAVVEDEMMAHSLAQIGC